MSAWLKAGLIGIAILVVLNLIGLIPVLGCLTMPLGIVAYVVVGALAASYMPPRREAGTAAGQGALAAVLAGFGGGLVGMIIGLIRTAMGGAFQGAEILSQLPPELRHQFRDIGISPDLIAGAGGIGAAAICGSLCCVGGIMIAMIIATIGAVIVSAETEGADETENWHMPFMGRGNMFGKQPFNSELTEEQQEEIDELITSLTEEGASCEEIHEALHDKLDEMGILDDRLDSAIEKTEQRY